MEGELIRRQAIQARRQSGLGRVRLTRRPAWAVLGIAAILLVAGIVGAAVHVQLPIYVAAPGRLLPRDGPLPMRSPVAGRLEALRVDEGDSVTAGQVLARVSAGEISERERGERRARHDALQTALRSVRDRARRTDARRQTQADAAERRLETTTRRLALVETRLELHRRHEARTRALLEDGMLARVDAEAVAAESLELELTASRAREALRAAEAELASVQAARAMDRLDAEAAAARLEADRAAAAAGLEAAEHAGRHALRAPVAARVAAVLRRSGEAVGSGTRVLELQPRDEPLVARVWLAADAAGVVEPGARVVLRIHAYPYRHHGTLTGQVAEVSRTSVPRAELGLPGAGRVFLVRVALPEDSVSTGGQPLALRPGMSLEARILLRRLPVYRWLARQGGG